mmetsp:Transcript_28533/g.71708  ORF Transcript_28533/g.71708 Transcript_28533/m.71708 type:complete len:255 (+) Transcript_28533:98-862(+)
MAGSHTSATADKRLIGPTGRTLSSEGWKTCGRVSPGGSRAQPGKTNETWPHRSCGRQILELNEAPSCRIYNKRLAPSLTRAGGRRSRRSGIIIADRSATRLLRLEQGQHCEGPCWDRDQVRRQRPTCCIDQGGGKRRLDSGGEEGWRLTNGLCRLVCLADLRWLPRDGAATCDRSHHRHDRAHHRIVEPVATHVNQINFEVFWNVTSDWRLVRPCVVGKKLATGGVIINSLCCEVPQAHDKGALHLPDVNHWIV